MDTLYRVLLGTIKHNFKELLPAFSLIGKGTETKKIKVLNQDYRVNY
jgi:hypothetical protein